MWCEGWQFTVHICNVLIVVHYLLYYMAYSTEWNWILSKNQVWQHCCSLSLGNWATNTPGVFRGGRTGARLSKHRPTLYTHMVADAWNILTRGILWCLESTEIRFWHVSWGGETCSSLSLFPLPQTTFLVIKFKKRPPHARPDSHPPSWNPEYAPGTNVVVV